MNILMIIKVSIFLLVFPVFADSKVALVIGNSEYNTTGDSLKNPTNDAQDIANKLKTFGYTTFVVKNVTKDTFFNALEKFEKSLQPNGTALFYYAGHGIQVDGRNYLVPVDALLNNRMRVDSEAISVLKVVELMQSSGTVNNLLILDACRNDPFPKEFRSVGQRGLTRMRDDLNTEHTMILYSASPGQVAQDGKGRNGVFTGALLTLMDQPNLALPQLYAQLKQKVKETSVDNSQLIYQEGDILADFVFNQINQQHSLPINLSEPAKQPIITTNNTDYQDNSSQQQQINNVLDERKNTLESWFFITLKVLGCIVLLIIFAVIYLIKSGKIKKILDWLNH